MAKFLMALGLKQAAAAAARGRRRLPGFLAGIAAAATLLFVPAGCRMPGAAGLGPSPDLRAPGAPSDLVAIALSGTEVELSWTDASSDEDGFHIQRRIGASGGYSPLATVPADTAGCLDAGLSPGTTYYYRVRSYNGQGESGWSNEAGIATSSASIGYTLQGDWRSLHPGDGFTPAVSGQAPASAAVPARPLPLKRTDPPAARAPEQIIVKFRDGLVDTDTLAAGTAGVAAERRKVDRPGLRLSVLRPIPGSGTTLQELLAYCRNRPEVEYAEVDHLLRASGPAVAFAVPGDPYFPRQWSFLQVGMPDVWDLATGNPQVIVAVIDTGAAYDLDDFSGTVFVPGRDIVNDDSDPYDDSGHGTHVAATIAESTHNALGAAGMAYGVSLMPVKVLGRDSLGWTSDVVEGIYWAVDHGAAVINLSLGGQGTQSLHDACRYAYQHGVPVVAAAGNGNAGVQYPAAYDELVLAVGATRLDRQRTSYSNFGPALDVVAPGGDLSVDQDGDGYFDGILQQTIRGYLPGPRYTDYTPGYFLMQGTSMACAHVSALAALLKTRHPGLTPDEVFSAATGTALDLGSPGRDDYYGHGLIDPLPALALGAASYPIGDSVSGSVVKSGGASGGWRIRTAPGTTVDIELTFSPAEGNLDLFLYDRSGAEVASSTGLTGRETLSYSTLSGGTYLVGVEYVP